MLAHGDNDDEGIFFKKRHFKKGILKKKQVLAQGDNDDGGIYGPSSTLDPHTQLPVYFPADDPQDAGLTRVLRLSLVSVPLPLPLLPFPSPPPSSQSEG